MTESNAPAGPSRRAIRPITQGARCRPAAHRGGHDRLDPVSVASPAVRHLTARGAHASWAAPGETPPVPAAAHPGADPFRSTIRHSRRHPRRHLEHPWRTVHRVLAAADLLVTPTLAVPPFARAAALRSDLSTARATEWLTLRNTWPCDLVGLPSVCLPRGVLHRVHAYEMATPQGRRRLPCCAPG